MNLQSEPNYSMEWGESRISNQPLKGNAILIKVE